jgi:predicted regulator of Ras-like GTPase activity (Roadblock/LC7/MglB family)
VKQALEPLVAVPGVIAAAVITSDGMPVAAPGAAGPRDGALAEGLLPETDALAALAAGWLDELGRALAPLSWDVPDSVVLRAARGTLCLRRSSGAIVLVCLQAGLAADQVELPLQAACARLERAMKRYRREGAGESPSGDFAPALPGARETPPGEPQNSPLAKRAGD